MHFTHFCLSQGRLHFFYWNLTIPISGTNMWRFCPVPQMNQAGYGSDFHAEHQLLQQRLKTAPYSSSITLCCNRAYRYFNIPLLTYTHPWFLRILLGVHSSASSSILYLSQELENQCPTHPILTLEPAWFYLLPQTQTQRYTGDGEAEVTEVHLFRLVHTAPTAWLQNKTFMEHVSSIHFYQKPLLFYQMNLCSLRILVIT